KWHLGVREGSRPHDRGFDEWFGFLAGCVDYYSHIFYFDMDSGRDPTHDLWEDGREVWRNGEYFTNLVTERAVAFIRRAARDGVPFFLYVPYSAPHYPMHAPREYLDRFPDLADDRRITAAMIAAMDTASARSSTSSSAQGCARTPRSSSRATTGRRARRVTG